jgi:hypothetical protein
MPTIKLKSHHDEIAELVHIVKKLVERVEVLEAQVRKETK